MAKRPLWKLFYANFVAGLGRGLGMAVGMTLIFGLVVYATTKLLARIVSLPVIGNFVAELVQYVNLYMQKGIPIR